MNARPIAFALLSLAAGAAHATDWEIDLDARLVDSDGRQSFLEGGLGAFRFAEHDCGLQLGRARFALMQSFGQVLKLHLDASSWGDVDNNPIDLTEAYLEYRPYPRGGVRTRVKAGAFYAPISLENRAAGWESPYTLSSSAINTWIGEELRTIGLEAQVDWLGTRTGHLFDVGLTAGLYGWNDPLGGLVASHGFALHDRQTTLFGRFGERGVPPVFGRELFHEIDGRAGGYVGIEARYLDRLVLRVLHYDNNGDPAAFDAELQDFAWETRFDSAGLRFESARGWTAIAQWLDGKTYIYPGFEIEWPFKARFALLSKRFGRQTLSARYDDFNVSSNLAAREGEQAGHAFTAAYVLERGPHWRFTLEWLRVTSRNWSRPIYLGEPTLATETKLELAARYAIGSLVH